MEPPLKEGKGDGIRRNSFFSRTFHLIDRQVFQKIALRSVLGGFENLVRLFAMSGDSPWPYEAAESQQRILKEILSRNQHTLFAKEHALSSGIGYDEFTKKVPIFSYEQIFPYIKRMLSGESNILTHYAVFEYAKSSGTSNGRSKYIPTSNEYIKGNHLKASFDMITAYARTHPHTNIFSGKAITINGSYSAVPESRFPAGDVSALMMKATPWWTAGARPYHKNLSLHPSWPYKADKIADATLDKNIVLLGGTPTWMIEILELAKKKSGAKTLSELWPNLEVFFHGAVSFAPYRKTCEALIGKKSFEFREAYNASEGFFAFEDDPIGHPGEMLLCTDHDIFYEFVRVEDCVPTGPAIPLTEVQKDIPYAMVITTTSGLWRYMIGDIVIFRTLNLYRLQIIGRTTQFINAFGEEVVEDNAVHAVEEAARESGAEVAAFTVAPTFKAKPSQGAHEWVVEFRTVPKDISVFSQALDDALRKRNSDYDAKRTQDIILGVPILHVAPIGTFRRFMETHGKLGGQHKVPLLCNERTILEEILKMVL